MNTTLMYCEICKQPLVHRKDQSLKVYLKRRFCSGCSKYGVKINKIGWHNPENDYKATPNYDSFSAGGRDRIKK